MLPFGAAVCQMKMLGVNYASSRSVRVQEHEIAEICRDETYYYVVSLIDVMG